MLAHIHIFVAQHYKDLSFAVSSKPVPLKFDWLNQYSLTSLGQDALQLEGIITLAKLKSSQFCIQL